MYDSILIPTDGSDGSDVAVEHAVDLADRYDAAMHALYVIEAGQMTEPLDDAEQSRIYERLENAGEQVVTEVADRAAAAGVEPVETAVEQGTPYERILDYADRNGVDMVVMATNGRTGDARDLLGSVTEQVVRSSPVPVVTVNVGEDR
jgi:nucleotide-binding universal stress UspA family protein